MSRRRLRRRNERQSLWLRDLRPTALRLSAPTARSLGVGLAVMSDAGPALPDSVVSFSRPEPRWAKWLLLALLLLSVGIVTVGVAAEEEALRLSQAAMPGLTPLGWWLSIWLAATVAFLGLVETLFSFRRSYGACSIDGDMLIFRPPLVREGHKLSRVEIAIDEISRWEETEHGFVVTTTPGSLPFLIPAATDSERAKAVAFLHRVPR